MYWYINFCISIVLKPQPHILLVLGDSLRCLFSPQYNGERNFNCGLFQKH